MAENEFDFYDKTALKSYNLSESMRYQLSMLERMDPFTKLHSENVASLVCRVCEYLHCKKNFTAYCTICAYLHDIGKLKVPPEILNKPAKLTDEEYSVIKTHTTLGYEMCMADIQLRPYALGAKCHHEALNGSGYPEGLSGKEVPYEAQIIRVADEYDAIVTKRQYKTHINISETLKELIGETEPAEMKKTVALDNEANGVKLGKLNKKIVKALFKVVINDIEYEISSVDTYVRFLKDQINRLTLISKYEQKASEAKKEKKKDYYLEGMKILFAPGENEENYKKILEEYNEAYLVRTSVIKKLYLEIEIIKKLQV